MSRDGVGRRTLRSGRGARNELRSRLGLLTVALLPLLGACDRGETSAASVAVDSAGVRVVDNVAADRPLGWRFEPVLRLGGRSEGPESFYGVNSFTVGSDASGNIHVLDRDGHRVVVFDAEGRHVRTAGRQGQGPGELAMPISLTVRPDGTAHVFDIGKGVVVGFGPDGVPLDTEERLPPQTRRVFSDGGFHSALSTTDDDGRMRHEFFWIVGADTMVLATAESPPGGTVELPSCGMAFSNLPRLFEPSPAWDGRGGRAALRTSFVYEIDVYARDGHVIRVRRAVDPVPTTPELAARELGEAMTMMTSAGPRECATDEVIERRGFSEFVPAIRQIRVDPAGRLWVSRGGPRPERTPTDIIDADGTYVGTLPAETPYPIGFLPDGRALVAETDELDVSRLVVYEVEEVPSGFEPE